MQNNNCPTCRRPFLFYHDLEADELGSDGETAEWMAQGDRRELEEIERAMSNGDINPAVRDLMTSYLNLSRGQERQTSQAEARRDSPEPSPYAAMFG